MRFSIIPALLALPLVGLASDIDADNVPQACLSTCQFSIDLTQRCDDQTNDDAAQTSCICGANDAQKNINDCANCLSNNGDPNNDADELLNSCGWTPGPATNSASYSPGTVSSRSTPPSSSSAGAGSGSAASSTPSTGSSRRAAEVGAGSIAVGGLVMAMI